VAEKEFYSHNIYSTFNSLDEYVKALHDLAIQNWVGFMRKSLLNNKL